MDFDNITSKDRGNALESNVEYIFKCGGFETERNVKLATYEIDVLAKLGDRKVVIECKNYQNSNLIVRNLIHMWNSKNKIINVNKIILVLAGIEIKKSDLELANSFGIEIWNEKDLSDLFLLALKPAELHKKLLEKIEFNPITINELYRNELLYLVIRPILGLYKPDDEFIYGYFHKCLTCFIRTELQLEGSSKYDRINYVELFEGTKQKKVFFNLINIERSEIEYWQQLTERLKNENILSKEMQKKYLTYMENLVAEYKAIKDFFIQADVKTKIRNLVKSRLHLSMFSDLSKSKFLIRNIKKSPTIEVETKENGIFIIKIADLNDKQVNIINWILTSENIKYHIQGPKSQTIVNEWRCSSIEEASEKTYRLLDEYIGFDENAILGDASLMKL